MFSIIKAGMASAKNELSIISNNVANANTTGFKKSIASYADLAPSSLSDSIQASSSGLGSLVEDTRLSQTQSSLLFTDKTTDLGLMGNGFFILQNPKDSMTSYSRNGSFSLDENGFLTTPDKCYVMGKPLVDGDFSTENIDIEGLLPLQIPAKKDDVVMSNLTIEEDGKISAQYGDDTTPIPIGTLALGLFANPEGLRELGNARYRATEKAGSLQLGTPTEAGFAAVKSGSLETSNVDITDELTAMIRAQQQFNGAARLMQTSSELLEKLTR
jgi:flagellar hook protein FlgE